ncbi:MAG: hypothetical protein ACLFVW_00680 [Phycisphaerae bacterium]
MELYALLITAMSVGFVHTVLGPDHYVPFVALSKAREWSLRRTGLITFLCGLGHVAGSVVLGGVGIAIGLASKRLEIIEEGRGEVAAWLLIGFGLAYTVWGIHRAVRNRPHRHVHAHTDGAAHEHEHTHTEEHTHPHNPEVKSATPWALFIIFVFGPCEPLIPLLMYPAARMGPGSVAAVAGVFAFTTIATMLVVVLAGAKGLSTIPASRFQRYSHALAGAAVLACGLAVHFGL